MDDGNLTLVKAGFTVTVFNVCLQCAHWTLVGNGILIGPGYFCENGFSLGLGSVYNKPEFRFPVCHLSN
jgi:hypothetical protein